MIEQLKDNIKSNIEKAELRKYDRTFAGNNVLINGFSKEEIDNTYNQLSEELGINYVGIDYNDIVILKSDTYKLEEKELYKISSENPKYNFDKLLSEEEYNNLMNTLSTSFLIIYKMSGSGNNIFINDYTKNIINSKKTVLHIYNIEGHINSIYRRFLLDFTRTKCANNKLLLNFIMASISFSNEIDKNDAIQIRMSDGKDQFFTVIEK